MQRTSICSNVTYNFSVGYLLNLVTWGEDWTLELCSLGTSIANLFSCIGKCIDWVLSYLSMYRCSHTGGQHHPWTPKFHLGVFLGHGTKIGRKWNVGCGSGLGVHCGVVRSYRKLVISRMLCTRGDFMNDSFFSHLLALDLMEAPLLSRFNSCHELE